MPDTSKMVIQAARKAGMTKTLAMVSAGKDSVALVATLVRNNVDAFYLNKYLVPDLDVEEEVLTGLERRFRIQIHRLPAPRRLGMLESDTLCVRHIWDASPSRQSAHSATFDRLAKRAAGTEWMTTGIRATDSINRRFAVMRHGNPNVKLKKFYPIADWTKKETLEFIEREKLPHSRVYTVVPRSIDAINLEHCYYLKKLHPPDWQKIIADFPLLDAIAWLYEKRQEAGLPVPPEGEI